ncbi:MAG: GAF domain-containing protein [Blastocatellia bacterium]|nr:GAF domain-containing protein [Blastocatellia bacterium]
MRFLFSIVLCLVSIVSAQAQIYRFKHYNSGTGLPNNGVYGIYQDSKGYVWFATDGGASRYDGVNFLTISVQEGLIDTSVRAILEDKNGYTWILTRAGASFYDGKKIINYTTAEGLPSNEIRSALRSKDGTIWFGTAAGLCRYDGQTFQNYTMADGLPKGPIWSILEDRLGLLWLGIRGGGLVSFDGKNFTVYGNQEGLTSTEVFSIAEDRKNGLWIATGDGLFLFNGTSFQRYSTQDGMSSNSTNSVLVDNQNRVWCGTYGGGINRLENGKFKVFDRSNGVPDNFITCLMTDFEGNIWFGTRWGGAFRFTSERFANYTSEVGLGTGAITGIAEDLKGQVWFSSINDGLYSLDNRGKLKHYTTENGLIEDRLWTLFIDSKGRVWTGGQRGVSYYENEKFRSFSLKDIGINTFISAISEDSQGRIWFGSQTSIANAVVAYDGQQFRAYSEKDGLATSQMNTFALDRLGRFWICTEKGLYRMEGERFVNFEGTLPSKHVRCFHQDEQENLWIGTDNGLLQVRKDRSSRIYTRKDGLIDNYIQVISSKNGITWVGSARGLSTFDGKDFHNYTTKDGLINSNIMTGVCLHQQDGSIWFATAEGAVRYQEIKEMIIPRSPKTVISQVRTGDDKLDLQPTVYLSYNQNNITFEFAGLSFVDEESIYYSYHLEGFDAGWSNQTKNRSIRFTNLPPGKYTFFVKSIGSTGIWSEPEFVNIEISKPVWQAWWFRVSCLVTLALVGYGIYSWRVRYLLNLNHKKIANFTQLLESIRIINSRLELNRVLQNIAAESARLIDGEPGGIGLVEADQLVFRRLWQKGQWQDSNLTFKLGEGIAGIVASHGVARIVNDPKTDPDVVFPELIDNYYVHGLMDVPIIDSNGKVIGVLDVRRKAGNRPFTDSDCKLVEELAYQAAVALENASLYGKLEEKSLMLSESLSEIERLYQNEQQINYALQELDQMKTDFMIVSSHEMRTPLTVLKGYIELILEGALGSLTKSQMRSLETCLKTVDRLISSFNEILEIVKIDANRINLDIVKLDLKWVAKDLLNELDKHLQDRNLTLSVEIESSLPKVFGDLEKLRMVLKNLLQNAIKFTPDDGQIYLKAKLEGDMVHIRVEDTGIGIESSELERIFEKFYTGTDAMYHSSGEYEFGTRGAGLGLTIVRGYVRAHQGMIWAESAGSGKGSSFHILLPVNKSLPKHPDKETNQHLTY